MKKIKKLVFLSGTRADFGKLKSLISKVAIDQKFEVSIFVTGMHMLEKFGYTHYEIDRSGFENVYKFVIVINCYKFLIYISIKSINLNNALFVRLL